MQAQYSLTQKDIEKAIQQMVSMEHKTAVENISVNLNITSGYSSADPRESGAATVSAIASVVEPV